MLRLIFVSIKCLYINVYVYKASKKVFYTLILKVILYYVAYMILLDYKFMNTSSLTKCMYVCEINVKFFIQFMSELPKHVVIDLGLLNG